MKEKFNDELENDETQNGESKKINMALYTLVVVGFVILFTVVAAFATIGIESKQKEMYTGDSNILEFLTTENEEVDTLPLMSDKPLWKFVCSIRDELHDVGVTNEHLIQSSIRSIDDRLYYSFVFTISEEENKYVNLQIWMDSQNNVESYMISNSEDEFYVSE